MKISMIAAVSANGVIGKDNDMAWHLPDDMKFFKQTTAGHHVLLGRKNWESIPLKWRPLPNRPNIVITRNDEYQADGGTVTSSLENALRIAKDASEEEAFIIGGGEIYRLGLPLSDRMYITEIDAQIDGDTFFPEWDKSAWIEVSRKHHESDERHAFPFDFVVYDKKE
ncbi:MAG: dihydrofolate reductase [Cyclobacteriaceae bacterium]